MKFFSKTFRISFIILIFSFILGTRGVGVGGAKKSSRSLVSKSKQSNNICNKKNDECMISLNSIIDHESDKFYKWSEDTDPECANLTVNFAKKGSLPARALVSFPGSGNTWLRHLIESSTGIFTGSVHTMKVILSRGFLGETRPLCDGSTILQKTHYLSAYLFNSTTHIEKSVELSDKVFGPFGYSGILIIRNPYDAILANWNRVNSRNKVGFAPVSSFSGTVWRTFVEETSERWGELIQVWFEKSKDLHVVLYEELEAHTERELIKIHQYLRFEVDPLRIKCTMRNSEGPFHRKQTSEREELMKSIYKDTLDMSGKFTLESIVQNHVDKVNEFFAEHNITIHLDYKLID